MLKSLLQIGWSDYEVRAYSALVRSGPSTGYRVAQEAEIPTSKIYEVLQRLVRRHAAMAISDDTMRLKFRPVAPISLLSQLTEEYREIFTALEEEISELLVISQSPSVSSDWLDWEQYKQSRLLMIETHQDSIASKINISGDNT